MSPGFNNKKLKTYDNRQVFNNKNFNNEKTKKDRQASEEIKQPLH